jgi:hypothetical protein
MRLSPFVTEMLAKRCGHTIRHSSDCDYIALDIESVTGEHIGVNTIKRLLGFIADERTPRYSTLDILARYLGYNDWGALRLADEGFSNSEFGERTELIVCHLVKGQEVHLTYPPNRSLNLLYEDDNKFRVTKSQNSKLQTGDLLTLTHIVRGYPLLISEVERDGCCLGSFTAGKAQGIDFELV